MSFLLRPVRSAVGSQVAQWLEYGEATTEVAVLAWLVERWERWLVAGAVGDALVANSTFVMFYYYYCVCCLSASFLSFKFFNKV